ncbi:MAG: NUDIX domain-containing protein [Atopobiaceae bacterium]|nr:NUDIX domain-containing protein [Atopobiaceae bacterium]
MQEMIDVYDRNRNHTGLTIPREGAFLHEGQYMLYVLALIEAPDGRFLITQRSPEKHWGAGWWEVTGGGVRAGETSLQALRREVPEETGLEIGPLDLSPAYSYENVDLKRGDNYLVDIYHVHLDFTANDVRLLDGEAVDFRLATWDEITRLAEQGIFLHYERLRQTLAAEGLLPE